MDSPTVVLPPAPTSPGPSVQAAQEEKGFFFFSAVIPLPPTTPRGLLINSAYVPKGAGRPLLLDFPGADTTGTPELNSSQTCRPSSPSVLFQFVGPALPSGLARPTTNPSLQMH